MKKLFNILLAVIITTVCAFSLSACAIDDGGNNGKTGLITSKDKNGNYVVRDFVYVDGCLDNGTLNIGDILEEKGITSAKISTGAFDGDDKIKTLIVSDKIVEIEQGAFRNMKSLETLVIPFVGKNAKADPKFGHTMETEGKSINKERTFSHFFGTTEYDKGIKMNNGYGDVYLPYTLKNVVIDATENVKYNVEGRKEGYAIGYEAFKNAKALQNITLKGVNLKEIGKEAFSGCTNLKSITLPNTITTIYDSAFSGCVQLTEVKIEEGASIVLKDNVFSGCTAMNKFASQIELTVDLDYFSNIGTGSLDFGRKVIYKVVNRGAFDTNSIFGSTEYSII